MRALVTGAAGFVGQWVCRALLDRGWEVVGAGEAGRPTGGVLGNASDAVTWVEADLRRQDEVSRMVDAARPDAVVHLAAVSFVPAAQGDPALAYEVNIVGTARLLTELRRRRAAGALDPVLLVIGSAEQYGRHEPGALPLREDAPQHPLTVYAATKAAQEVVALEAARSEGLRVVLTRSFNHSGPGQAEHFLLPALVKRALAVRSGGAPTLRLGNTATVRDFLHVADVAEAYLRLIERGVPGEVYNVCSGRGVSVAELAALVLQKLGVQATVESDAALVRRVDVPALVGDPAKVHAATGWSPVRTCDDIIDDLIHAATL